MVERETKILRVQLRIPGLDSSMFQRALHPVQAGVKYRQVSFAGGCNLV